MELPNAPDINQAKAPNETELFHFRKPMNPLHEQIQEIAVQKLVGKSNLRNEAIDMAPYQSYLKKVTLKLRTEHRTGSSGINIVHARSFMMDLLIQQLFKDVSTLYAEEIPAKAQLAAVAFGGYGRHELNPQSDVDIMILSEGGFKKHGGAEKWMEKFCALFHQTLLDLKLKLGYITRNIDDCVHFSNEDVKTKTSLIETRLLAGNGTVYQNMQKAMLEQCVQGKENEYLAARLNDQRTRRQRYGNTPFMQEPEIKNGCGGLRDYQNLIWMAYFKYRVKSLEDLEKNRHINKAEYRHLSEAYDFLQRVRNEMHYRKNRAEDKLYKTSSLRLPTVWDSRKRLPASGSKPSCRWFTSTCAKSSCSPGNWKKAWHWIPNPRQNLSGINSFQKPKKSNHPNRWMVFILKRNGFAPNHGVSSVNNLVG
jgi:[protein-PII] uridylyltransferase